MGNLATPLFLGAPGFRAVEVYRGGGDSAGRDGYLFGIDAGIPVKTFADDGRGSVPGTRYEYEEPVKARESRGFWGRAP